MAHGWGVPASAPGTRAIANSRPRHWDLTFATHPEDEST